LGSRCIMNVDVDYLEIAMTSNLPDLR
jgi:hypothetical protein